MVSFRYGTMVLVYGRIRFDGVDMRGRGVHPLYDLYDL